MFKSIKYIIICLAFSSNCFAEKVTVAYGNTLAPWVMAETDSGILVDLVAAALLPLGYEIDNVYFPYARRIESYKTKLVDVVCDISTVNIEYSNLKGHFSGEQYSYENYFFALDKNDFSFNKISDLKNHTVLSWQGAKFKLGDEYETMATSNPDYMETHNQELQVKMLYGGRVDVIQLDNNIFEYYRGKIAKEGGFDMSQGVDKFGLLAKSHNGFLFQDSKVRNDFIQQIALMKTNGQYQKIFQKYLQSE